MNRRAVKIPQLPKELKTLKKQFKVVNEQECQPLAELRDILRKKLMGLCRAEWHRKQGRERARKQALFIKNPFGFTKKLLGDKRSGHLECSAAEVNTYLHNTFRNPERGRELDLNKALIYPDPPTVEFNLREPSWKEIHSSHSSS